MIRNICALMVCLVLCAALPVRAQETNVMSPSEIFLVQKDIRKQAEAPVKPADVGGAAGGDYSKIAVETTSDRTTVSFKVGDSWVFVQPVEAKGDNIVYDKTFDLSLSASTPFNQDKDKGKDLGDISGLTTGTNAKLQGGLMWWARVDRDTTRNIENICNNAVTDLYESVSRDTQYSFAWPSGRSLPPNTKESALLFEDQGVDCVKMLLSDDGLQGAIDSVNLANKNYAKDHPSFELPAPVHLKAEPAHPRTWHWMQLQELQQKARHANHGMIFAITANRQEFDYADAATPATVNKAIKWGYGASLGYTLILPKSVFLAGVSYEQAYKGGKDTQICSPIGTTGSLMCQNAALLAPAKKEDEIVSVEYRTIIPWRIPIALAPRVQFSLKQSQFGVKLPIYVAPDPKHVLDGGIAFAWTEEDHFGVSIFVSKAFKFFD